jgi:hypothetical protein
MSTHTHAAAAQESIALEIYRDDGPLARALGSTLGAALGLPPVALVVAGVLPLVALIALEGSGASDGVAAGAVAWLVLAGGASSGRPDAGSLRWALLPILRLGEYAGILWLAAIAGGSGPAAAFALLAALAFHHYDLVYRLRFQGRPPPRWIGDLAGGWEGRLVAGWVLLAAGTLPAGFFALAAALALLFVGESVASWSRAGNLEAAVSYQDEEAQEE